MAFGKPDFVLTDSMKEQIKAFALTVPHEETCGFILKDGSVTQAQNIFFNAALEPLEHEALVAQLDELQIRDISPDAELDEIRKAISLRIGIAISARDRLAAESKGIAAVWHSHCLDSSPGMLTYEDSSVLGIHSDITQSKLQRLPYVLWHVGFDEWDMYDPYGLNPYPLRQQIANPGNPEEYTKLPYCWNRWDCLEAPRAVLWGMFEIDLGIHLRSNRLEYLAEGWQRYIEGFPKVGFKEIQMFSDMRFKAGDCLLMQLPGYKALHHLGVCVDEKQQRMLHIIDGRVSEIEHIAKWRRFARVTFRHEKFL